jgi:flagellar hook-associated protein 2
MADVSIPGVTDKYKTNDLVKALVEAERIPLVREQEKLDGFKTEQQNWQRINQYMSALRDTSRSLYSFNNPFSEKISSSTQEASVTAQPGRDAGVGSFKVDIERIASADRFLSENLDKDTIVPEGSYTYKVGDKSVNYNWKGGKLSDFVTGLNRRGNNLIKASLIGVTSSNQSLLLESLVTGDGNKLIFEDQALDFALKTNMIRSVPSNQLEFAKTTQELGSISSRNSAVILNGTIFLSPESGFEAAIPKQVLQDQASVIQFSIEGKTVPDVTISEIFETEPVLPSPSSINFKGITVYNEQLETTLPPAMPVEKREPVESNSYIYIKNNDGSLIPFPSDSSDAKKNITIKVSDYPNMQSIIVKNDNTGKEISLSSFQSFNPSHANGYEPVNPVSIAQDAKLKYEGITMTRSTNKIDDIVPNVTLTLESPTEKTAVITIKPDTEKAKDELITFVGRYNQLLAEINILTQSKPEIISEIQYFTKEESEEAEKRLGSLRTEFSLTNSKTSLQNIMSNSYRTSDNAVLTMLSQIGISTKSAAGGAVSSSQLRGYLEIDEKKLDSALNDNMNEIKSLFGYDANGDLIVDSGVAYQLEQHLQAFVQTGGILALKRSTLDSKITTSQKQIERLETQVAKKEQELKTKYGSMESTLNSLQSQSDTITNFNNSNNSKN